MAISAPGSGKLFVYAKISEIRESIEEQTSKTSSHGDLLECRTPVRECMSDLGFNDPALACNPEGYEGQLMIMRKVDKNGQVRKYD